MADEKRYYIRNVGHEAGDLALWWKPGRSGYTVDIEKAGLYTESDVRALHRSEDVGIEASLVRDNSIRAVSIERVRSLPEAFPRPKPPPPPLPVVPATCGDCDWVFEDVCAHNDRRAGFEIDVEKVPPTQCPIRKERANSEKTL